MRDNGYVRMLTAALVLAAAATVLAGCNGGPGDRPQSPKAVVYMCEETGELFGIPVDLAGDEELFPPIVCPTTGKRTAVRATFYRRKSDGQPELYKLEKYTDDQIRRLERLQKSIPPEQREDVDPEGQLGSEGEGPMVKYPREENPQWRTPRPDQPVKNPQAELKEMQERYQNLMTVVPYDDPKWTKIYKREELSQW
jgi:hypothetical protein